MDTSSTTQSGRFIDLGIAPKLLDILTSHDYITPTPIQAASIPAGIRGEDIIGIAQTGTGKTLAFTIPLIQQIAATKGTGLIVLPTRELADQVEETLFKIGKTLGIRTALLIGGAAMGKQIADLRKKPHVIVGTPGRIIDHLEQRTLKLDTTTVLILDEADRMLDMGFEPQIRQVLATVPKERQTMLFSATMPPEIVRIAEQYMKKPTRIEVARAGLTAETIEQELFIIDKTSKPTLLAQMLTEHAGTVLVFTRTKYAASRITRLLREKSITAAEIHSDRSLSQRREALDGFKRGKYRVLIATDIAARGIDVKNISLVINYDLPENPEDYVHRIGRTGRAQALGKAISFVEPQQRFDVRAIERLISKKLPLTEKRVKRSEDEIRAQAEEFAKTRIPEREAREYSSRNTGRREYGTGQASAPRSSSFGTRKPYERRPYGTQDAGGRPASRSRSYDSSPARSKSYGSSRSGDTDTRPSTKSSAHPLPWMRNKRSR